MGLVYLLEVVVFFVGDPSRQGYLACVAEQSFLQGVLREGWGRRLLNVWCFALLNGLLLLGRSLRDWREGFYWLFSVCSTAEGLYIFVAN